MLGLVCHYLEPVRKRNGRVEHLNLLGERSLQLGRFQEGKYTEEGIFTVYKSNVDRVLAILPRLLTENIRCFRLSSSLFPLSDKVPSYLWDHPEIRAALGSIGDFVRKNGMRMVTHPSQFCVLNSESPATILNAIVDLKMHAWIFDQCGFDVSPFYAINIHAGCGQRFDALVHTINKVLPPNVRGRLTLENCEYVASVNDLFDVYLRTGIPIVFDSHHHTFLTGNLSMNHAYARAMSTWRNGIKPLQHLANSEPGTEKESVGVRRKHSFDAHYIPECQKKGVRCDEIDLECEFKGKNYAITTLRAMLELQRDS